MAQPNFLSRIIFGILIIAGLLSPFSHLHAQCEKSGSPLEINSSQTWNTTHNLTNDLIIDSNVTLTIRDTVTFRHDAYLIVRPGGRLFVYGGTLTHNCSSHVWHGIELHGHSDRNQLSGGGYDPGQGVVVMDSGSRIEWAVTGIATYQGSIAIVSNSTLINCRKMIGMDEYSQPINTSTNSSRFENCNFYCTDTLPGYYYHGHHQGTDMFVSLWAVKGIKFLGDSFVTTLNHSIADSSLGTGIYAIDASFTVRQAGPYDTLQVGQSSCHAAHGRKNVFVGMDYGIYYKSRTANYQPKIFESVFSNCQLSGIELVGSYFAEVRRNFFFWNSSFLSPSSSVCCIYSHSGQGFLIDSNTFDVDSNLSATIYPIFIVTSGQIKSYITSNKITAAQRTGTYITRFSPNLVINCNDFIQGQSDIAISDHSIYGFSDQGSQATGAGNKFSSHTTANIFNTIPFHYYQDQSSGRYHPDKSGGIQLSTSNNQNSCTPQCDY